MAERDDDDERFQEKARPPKVRPRDDEGIRPPKAKSAPRPDDDWDDEDDDRPRRRDSRDRRPPGRRRRDDDGVATIIPYRNGMALAGYYCGVFSLIPFIGAILGPLALIFGIVGLRRVSRNPEVKGTGHAITAIVLGSIGALYNWVIVAFIIIGIVASRH